MTFHCGHSYFSAWAGSLPREEETPYLLHWDGDILWCLPREPADGSSLLGRVPGLCSLVGNSPPTSCHSLETFINESLDSSI